MLKPNLKNILRLAYLCFLLLILGFITLISSASSPTLAQSNWTTYEDDDPLVLPGYSEGDWQTVSIPEAVGGNLTWTDVPSAELVFYFEGSAIEILYSRGPEGGDFHISLDDMTWPQFNSYAEQYLYGTSIQQFNIAPGIHQLVITNDDGALWIEAIRVQEGELLPATQWTNYASDDPEVLYTGMWASMPSVDPTTGLVMYSFTGERSISVRFQGTGIRVIYSREYQSGLNFQAELDNTAIQSVSNPAPSENTQHEIVFDALPYDEHTLQITIAEGTLWVERIDIQGILLPSEAPLESSAPTSAPLLLELTLPFVFTEVSTVEELISAVEAANAANNEHHVILLAPGTYTFDSSHRMWDEAGLIVADYKTVTFIGMGGIDPETGDSLLPADNPASQSWPWSTLDVDPASGLTVLDTKGGSTVRLYNIQIRGGGGNPSLRYAGAGIRNGGNLFLYNSRLEDNNANVKAGAILNFAKLTTINTALSDNHAVYGSAVYKVQTTSIFSYCSTYEGNIAYLGALYLETGDSVDIRHSNFIGNETFDENFDTFADVDSLSAVTLPNNYWSGSVGESVSENVNRSPQSPTRILYGSFSNEGEPCYVPPPPTLCPTSTLEMQAFGATSGESFLSPVCQQTVLACDGTSQTDIDAINSIAATLETYNVILAIDPINGGCWTREKADIVLQAVELQDTAIGDTTGEAKGFTDFFQWDIRVYMSKRTPQEPELRGAAALTCTSVPTTLCSYTSGNGERGIWIWGSGRVLWGDATGPIFGVDLMIHEFGHMLNDDWRINDNGVSLSKSLGQALDHFAFTRPNYILVDGLPVSTWGNLSGGQSTDRDELQAGRIYRDPSSQGERVAEAYAVWVTGKYNKNPLDQTLVDDQLCSVLDGVPLTLSQIIARQRIFWQAIFNGDIEPGTLPEDTVCTILS